MYICSECFNNLKWPPCFCEVFRRSKGPCEYCKKIKNTVDHICYKHLEKKEENNENIKNK